MAEHINKTDTLNEGRVKLNAAISDSNIAKDKATQADVKSTQALANSESTQTQLDTIVIEGDSSVEAAQARVDEKGEGHATLKARIDDGFEKTSSQLVNKANISELEKIVVDVTSRGFVGDGTVSDTGIINDIIVEVSSRGGGSVFIPSKHSPYLIQVGTGIQMKDNVRLLLDNNAALKATPSSSSGYQIIRCEDINNFTIEGGQIIGERYEHIGDIGQHGFGIYIAGCSDFEINVNKISECWGDGIYIGASSNKEFSDNGVINNVLCDFNRRQGISITSGRDIKLNDVKLLNTGGHPPHSGLDIEPNSPADWLENIIINNPYTENNQDYGIIVSVGKMIGSNKEISVTISNHRDDGSQLGFGVVNCNGALNGTIINENPNYVNNGDKGVFIRDHHTRAPKIKIIRPIIKKSFSERDTKSESSRYGGAITILRDEVDSKTGSLGNIEIVEPYIDSDLSYSDISIYDDIKAVEDITITDPIFLKDRIVRTNTPTNLIDITDKNKQLLINLVEVGSFPVLNNIIYKHFSNAGAVGNRSISLGDDLPVGTSLSIQNTKDDKITIFTSVVIKPYQDTASTITSESTGNKLNLRKIRPTVWVVEDIIGNWSGLNV